MRGALRVVHQHVGQQIGAHDGTFVVADHRHHGVSAGGLVEGRVHRAVDRAVAPQVEAGRLHLGQRALALGRQVLRLRQIGRDQRGARVGLHHHCRERQRVGGRLDEVILADDVVRQPLPGLGFGLPCVDIQRLVGLAVIGDRHDPGGLRRRLALELERVVRALGNQGGGDGLGRLQQVAAGAPFQEAHARDRTDSCPKRPGDRTGHEDYLCAVRVGDGAAGLADR